MTTRPYRLALVLTGLGLVLAGCTPAPTPYQPTDGQFGYTTQQIEDNRFRVSFSGNVATPRETVENFLLMRAAEVTLETGHDYFTVVNRDVEAYGAGVAAPRIGVGVGGGTGGNVGLGVGLSTLFGGAPSARYTSFADIIVFQGEKPPGDPRSYDARDVIQRLQPQLMPAG